MNGENVTYRAGRVLVTDEQLVEWIVSDDQQGRPIAAQGPCPSCDHITSGDVTLNVYAQGAGGARVDTISATERVTRVFECECGQAHPDGADTPVIWQSCGRWWLASIRLTADGPGQRVRRGIDDTLLNAAKAVEAAVDTEETRLRSSAGQWIAAVTALFGLFGLSGLVAGKDSLTGLPTEARVVAAVVAALALIAAAAAILLSYRAAYDWPVLVDVGDDQKLRAWYNSRRWRLGIAADDLKNGVRWAMAALGLLGLAVGVIWFWPRAAPQPLVEVTRNDDSAVCGTLLDTSANGSIRVKTLTGPVEPIPAIQVRSVKTTTAAKCRGG